MGDRERERRNGRLRAALGAAGVALAGLLAALGLGRLLRRRQAAPAAPTPPPRPPGLLRGHEVKDASAGCVITVGVGMIVAAVVMSVGLWAMFDFFATGAQRRDLATVPVFSTAPPPGPQLEVDPPADLARVRSREEALLNSYDWVDRQRGIVRIPIDRAMDLIVQQGLPGTSTAPGTPAAPGTPRTPATPSGRRP